MKSVNYALRKAYKASLNGLTANSNPVPVYYMEAPEDDTSPAYVLLVSPSNVDNADFATSNTNTSIQVQIHVWSENGNAGKTVDDIADDILQTLYPDGQTKLNMDADGFQFKGISLTGDNDGLNVRAGNRHFVQRILTFSNRIYHK